MTEDNVVKRHVSTFSGANGGNCVEVALLDDGRIRLTETKDPENSVYTDLGSADAFIRGAKHGEFDWLLSDPT